MKSKLISIALLLLIVLSSVVCFAGQLDNNNTANKIAPMGVYVAECPRCSADSYDPTETGNFKCDKCGYKFHTLKLK